ncbi:hypothetical protein AMTRI_Chr06g174080 [Amborella trichopoda]
MGAKRLKKGGLLRSLNVFHTFLQKNHEVADLMLISINIHKSTCHLLSCNLCFLVRVDDTVHTVILIMLGSHDRHGRLPVLGKNSDDFFLYRANSDFIALSPVVPIGRTGGRNFLLHKKK